MGLRLSLFLGVNPLTLEKPKHLKLCFREPLTPEIRFPRTAKYRKSRFREDLF